MASLWQQAGCHASLGYYNKNIFNTRLYQTLPLLHLSTSHTHTPTPPPPPPLNLPTQPIHKSTPGHSTLPKIPLTATTVHPLTQTRSAPSQNAIRLILFHSIKHPYLGSHLGATSCLWIISKRDRFFSDLNYCRFRKKFPRLLCFSFKSNLWINRSIYPNEQRHKCDIRNQNS